MVRFRHGVKLICFCTKCGKKMSEDAMFCIKCCNKIERNFNVPEENKLSAAPQPQYYASQYGMPAPAVPKKASWLKKYILIPMGIFVAVAVLIAGIIEGLDTTSQNNNSYGQDGEGYINGNYGGNAVRFCGSCYGTGKCNVCHGRAICQVCFGRGGMSVVTYGQDVDDWVICEGCKGNRKCKYCNGDGRCSSCGGSGRY